MNINPPRVSVIMGVFNSEKYLREAVESILGQTLTNFEFIIIDDGSTDHTFSMLNSYAKEDSRIQVHGFEQNRGLSTVLNYGIQLAHGEYIARMDADDISLPKRLCAQASYLDENPEIGVCGSWVEIFGIVAEGIWDHPKSHEAIWARMLFQNSLAHPSVMMRAKLMKQHNLFYDENVRYAQDYELWSRAVSYTKMANLDQVLLRHRRHKQSIGEKFYQEQMMVHMAVYRRLLESLGVYCTDEEIKLHYQIGIYQIEKDPDFLRRARSWLEALLISNDNKKVFSPEYLNSEVSKRWTIVCQRSRVHPILLLFHIIRSPLPFDGEIGFSKIVVGFRVLIRRLISFIARPVK